MVFCVLTDQREEELPQCDVAVFGFGILGEVDYERELKGETEKFEDAARLSKSSNCGLVCGCRTISRGLVRKSASVADRGKLLGISDMNHVLDDEDYKSGASLGLYKINGCKVGVCIENDLLFPDTFKSTEYHTANRYYCSYSGSPILNRPIAYFHFLKMDLSSLARADFTS